MALAPGHGSLEHAAAQPASPPPHALAQASGSASAAGEMHTAARGYAGRRELYFT